MLTVKLEEISEEGLDLSWEEEKASLMAYLEGFSKIDFDFESPLQSKVHIKRAGRSVLITGEVKATLALQCVRCLKKYIYPVSSKFELALYPLKDAPSEEELELDSQDMEASFYEAGEIHLSEIACEEIFLEIPLQPTCREECKGLCSICGQDLNLSTCQCVKEEWTSGFSALQKLKLD